MSQLVQDAERGVAISVVPERAPLLTLTLQDGPQEVLAIDVWPDRLRRRERDRPATIVEIDRDVAARLAERAESLVR